MYVLWVRQIGLNWNIPSLCPAFPSPCVSLCCYCESTVHNKTVCIPWTQIGKSSTSPRVLYASLCSHFTDEPDQINRVNNIFLKKDAAKQSPWSCFHRTLTDCNMKSCVLVNTQVETLALCFFLFFFCWRWLCIAKSVLHCFSVDINNCPNV